MTPLAVLAWLLVVVNGGTVLWLATWDSAGMDAAGRGMAVVYTAAYGIFVLVGVAILVAGRPRDSTGLL